MSDEIIQLEVLKIIIDILLMNCIGWPIYFLQKWSEPYKRAFYCEDTSIKFHPGKSFTLKSWVVYYVVGIGVVCGVITITEFLARPKGQLKQSYNLLGVRIPHWIYNLYCVIGVYAYGAVFTRFVVNVLKLTGILRPSFLALCQPDVCEGTYPPYQVHEVYTCTNNDVKNNKHLRFSFPSGHSAMSMYMMMFLALYWQRRVTWTGSKLLRHFLQSIALLFSLAVGVNRVGVYRHHVSDVIFGWIMGGLIGIVTSRICFASFDTTIVNVEDNKQAV